MKKSKMGIIGILFVILVVVAVSGCLGGDDTGSDAYTITSDSVNGTDYQVYTVKDTGNKYVITEIVGYDYDRRVKNLDGGVESNAYGVDATEYTIDDINYVYFRTDAGVGMLIDMESLDNTEEMKGVINHFISK